MKKSGSRCSLTEKERRDQMSHFFSALKFLIPNLTTKPSKEEIVAGTISCIRSLKEEIARLETRKKSLPPPPQHTLNHCSSSGAEVTVSGDGVVFFGVRLIFRRHLATELFRVFEKHKAEVLAASVSVDEGVLVVAVTAAVDAKETIEMIRREITDL